MASQFSTLMALSAMQTQQSQAAVQSSLAERKRKEEQRRREQEIREGKQREMEAKLRLKHFEDEKKEKERKERLEKERALKEAEKQKREAAMRDSLRYGPKKSSNKGGSGYPAVNGHTREELRKLRLPVDDDDDANGHVLTREEKRERKLQNDLKFSARSKRSSHAMGYQKSGRRLPGGALDITGVSSSQSPASSQSVKARLAAIPNTLTRLNVVKRDTRTIDEIVRDREREKEGRVLNGDQAKEFHDWFGKDKKKDVPVAKKNTLSAPESRSDTPGSQDSVPSRGTSALSKEIPKPTPSLSSLNKTAPPKSSISNVTSVKFSKQKTTVSTTPLIHSPLSRDSASKSPHPAPVSTKKRPRSASMSSDSAGSPPPVKRRAQTETENYRAEIWKLFGKDRSSYVSNYVDSDDDDMEADASILEREEKRSALLAKKEDEAALREEKLREEEKRRRKLEKGRR